MREADVWFMCRAGFVETWRAIGLSGGDEALQAFKEEWPAFAIVEVDQRLVEEAAKVAMARGLRSLDSLHLGSALVLPREELIFATWDHRLHAAAIAEGLEMLPRILD